MENMPLAFHILLSKNMASFINSQRGGQKLIYQGFIYTKNKFNAANGKTYWRCELYDIQKKKLLY